MTITLTREIKKAIGTAKRNNITVIDEFGYDIASRVWFINSRVIDEFDHDITNIVTVTRN